MKLVTACRKGVMPTVALFALLVPNGAIGDTVTIGFEAGEGYSTGSINGQPGTGNNWFVAHTGYDQEVTAAGAFSGTQSFRWSNKVFDGIVQSVESPTIGVPAGETGTFAFNGAVPAGAGVRRFIQDFWIRTVATSADPGMNVNLSMDDRTGNRMTFLRLRENSGSLDATYQGYDNNNTVGFSDDDDFPITPVASGLSWGTWYHVRLVADFLDGRDNDIVYIYVGTTAVLTGADLRAISNTWEEFYRDFEVESTHAVNCTLIRISSPNGGNMPEGVYLDDLTMTSEALTSSPNKLPVDLNGTYFSGSSAGGVSGIASATTNSLGHPSGLGPVFERSGGALAQNGTYTPFANLQNFGKPPTRLDQVNMAGERFFFDVEIVQLSLTSVDVFQVGMGRGVTGTNSTPEVWIQFQDVGPNHVQVELKTDTSVPGPSETFADSNFFAVTGEVNASGTQMSATVTPLNGPNAGMPVVIGPLTLNAEDNVSSTSFFAGWLGNETKSRSKARLSDFTTGVGRNWLYLFADDAYVRPGEQVSFRLGMANLAQPVFGFQAFVLGDTPMFMNGVYTSEPFSTHINSPIAPGPGGVFTLDGGVAFGGSPTSVDATLGALNFTAGASGSTGMIFAAHDPPSRFGDGTVQGVDANTRDSNTVLVDGAPPVIVNIRVMQGGNDLTMGGTGVQGSYTVSVEVTDAGSPYSGLDSLPQIRLQKPGSPDIVLDTYAGAGNEFKADFTLGAADVCGTYRAVVVATDEVGRLTEGLDSFAVNTAQVTVQVILANFDQPTTVIRGIEFVLGGTGGTNAPIRTCKDVTFTDGTGTVVLTASDGVPCTEGAAARPTKISAKDVKHTLRALGDLSHGGNSQYGASLTLRGGDATNDNLIDITDYGVFAFKFGQNLGANTLGCDPPTTATSHPDFSGNGIVGTGDYTFIQAQFLRFGDDEPGNYLRPRPQPKKRATVKEMALWVPETTARAFDINGDGWITYEEITRWLRKRGGG